MERGLGLQNMELSTGIRRRVLTGERSKPAPKAQLLMEERASMLPPPHATEQVGRVRSGRLPQLPTEAVRNRVPGAFTRAD